MAVKCSCGPGESCPACGSQADSYWCESCELAVSEKRCPLCGLKTKKQRILNLH